MKHLNLFKEFLNKSPRDIIRQQMKDIKKEGYTPQVDLVFENQCNSFISGDISIYQFESYLEEDLGLNVVNEELLGWFKKVAVKFFQRVINKVKIFFTSIFSKIKENREKIMQMLCVIVDKVMSGLKKFGKWIKENKKGLHTLVVKIIVSLSISAVVTYILSMFGAGWVTAMGVKMGASAVGKNVGSNVAKSVVGEKKFNYLKNYQEVFESTKDKLLKIGDGLKKFFNILKKFKIAILIFFGVVFILNLIFYPIFEPVLEIANMTRLSDVFSNDFSIPSPGKISKVDIDEISSDTIKTDVDIKLDLGETGKEYIDNVDETNNEIIKNIKTSISDVNKNIVDNPELASKNVANIVNQLREEIQDSEPGTIQDVSVKDAIDLDDETVNKDIEDMGDKENVDGIDSNIGDSIDLDSPEVRKNIESLFKNNLSSLVDKNSQGFFDKDGAITVYGANNPVVINGFKVELNNARFDIKDGEITKIKRLILEVTDKDGRTIEIVTSPGGDATNVFSTSLKPVEGYEEMTYKQYEERGFGITTDVKDLSEKNFKKIWVKSYNQEELIEITKKLEIKDPNAFVEQAEVEQKLGNFDYLKSKLGLERSEVMDLSDDISKIDKMDVDVLKQKYNELIGNDKVSTADMKLALLKYKIDNPDKNL